MKVKVVVLLVIILVGILLINSILQEQKKIDMELSTHYTSLSFVNRYLEDIISSDYKLDEGDIKKLMKIAQELEVLRYSYKLIANSKEDIRLMDNYISNYSYSFINSFPSLDEVNKGEIYSLYLNMKAWIEWVEVNSAIGDESEYRVIKKYSFSELLEETYLDRLGNRPGF